jgi:hypothetical protein
MISISSNPPPLPARPAPEKWPQVWFVALAHPRPETYAEIASGSSVRYAPAIAWLTSVSPLYAMLAVLLVGLVISVRPSLLAGFWKLYPGGLGSHLLASAGLLFLVSFVLAMLLAIVVGLLEARLLSWFSQGSGGAGKTVQYFYTLAAIKAGYPVAVMLGGLLLAIPVIGFAAGIALSLGPLYLVLLQILAVKGISGLSTGKAVSIWLGVRLTLLVLFFIFSFILLHGIFAPLYRAVACVGALAT